MHRSTVLHQVALALLVSVACLATGMAFDAPTLDAPSVVAADSLGADASAGFFGRCPEVNDAGCDFVGYACSGYNCCCLYACGSNICEPNDPFFPLTPDWAS